MEPQNPFPGMNPYLEGRGHVHLMLAAYSVDVLQERLPDELRARAEERVFIESFQERRWVRPDVYVVEERRGGSGVQPSAGGGVAVAEPLIFPIRDEEVTEKYVTIIDARSGGQVVTIEFISPSNKRKGGPGRKLFVQKQAEAMDAGVNLVEIDLNRHGKSVSLASKYVPAECTATYHTSIWRGDSPFHVAYYPMPLRARLPVIPIPLRPTDPDATLDLQALIDMVYTRGRYDDIDYSREPEPPLTGEDEAWLSELLRQKSLRN
jgi:hypothetical protein